MESVCTSNFGEIKAVAFDIDGTLYKELPFNLMVAPHFIFHLNFFLKYNKARKELRNKDFYEDFNLAQAQMMAEKLHCTPEAAQQKLEKIVYSGLRKYFLKLKPYKGALEFIKRLKENGVKVAVLSDFPPEQKGDIWGMKQYCDFTLGSEQTGSLKPSPFVFEKLKEKLEVPAEEILYVGNNHKYDIEGSHKAGMKSAWIITPAKKRSGAVSEIADIIFTEYSELENKFFGNL